MKCPWSRDKDLLLQVAADSCQDFTYLGMHRFELEHSDIVSHYIYRPAQGISMVVCLTEDFTRSYYGWIAVHQLDFMGTIIVTDITSASVLLWRRIVTSTGPNPGGRFLLLAQSLSGIQSSAGSITESMVVY